MLKVKQNKRRVLDNSEQRIKLSQEAGDVFYHPKYTDKQIGEWD